MIPVGVVLEPKGVLRLTELLENAETDVQDLDKAGAWQDVSDILSDEFEKLFAAQGGSGGPRWSRLSPVTLRIKAKRHQNNASRIGWATGRMAQSLIEPTHPSALELRSPMQFIRGTAVANKGVSYPSIFEHGRRGQPPRPIIGRLFRRGNTRTITRIVEAIEKRILDFDGK